jgi:formylglycine-generating enzyme required for sulfatase activity
MIVIPAGTFAMGTKDDPFADPPPNSREQPQRTVSINAFAFGKYEITQEQWYAVIGTMPSHFKGRTLPVEQVSWNDAQEFISKLSAKTGKKYRLPSEAESEYAARAGSQTAYSFGDDARELARYAWFEGNSGEQTHPVGEKPPNPFGLYDLHGNVWEWTEDCWSENYSSAPTEGSAWTTGNCSQRVMRGGSWLSYAKDLRSAFRVRSAVSVGDGGGGFRVARDY